MNDCIFCAIVRGESGSLIWQNDVAVAFHTTQPQSPVHVLVAPKVHIVNLDDLDDAELAGKLLLATREVAAQMGIKGAWRMRVNNGAEAGQTISHLHFHVTGGKQQAE